MPSTTIGPDTWVALSYTLFNEGGEVVEQATHQQPLTYIHGYAQILPGLERVLEGLRAGERTEIVVDPDEAFGERDDSGVFEVDRDDFPDAAGVTAGDEFLAQSPGGDPITMRVIEVLADAFVVDTNHPLAGQRVKFRVEIADVRAASEAEIALAQRDLEERVADHAEWCCEHHDHEAMVSPEHLVQLSRKH